jgi:hypothetical protein
VNVVRPKESSFFCSLSFGARSVLQLLQSLFLGAAFFCNARLNNLGERKDLYLYALGWCCHERFNYSAGRAELSVFYGFYYCSAEAN